MAYAVVQHASGSGSGTNLTTSKSLPGNPTVGNWIIAAVCLQNLAALTLCPIDTTKWFYVDECLHSHPSGSPNVNNILRIIARKVVAGDTSAMPAFCSSGLSFNAWMAVEVSGGSGTWATDFHSARNAVNIDGVAAITTPNDTTLVANTFALAFGAGYNESANSTLDVGWTVDETNHFAANYGSWICGHQAISAAGTKFSATLTRAGSSGNPKAAITVLLTPSQPVTPHIKRQRAWSGGSSAGTPGSATMGGDPINGNLLVSHLFWADGSVAGPTVGGSWTNYASALNGSNPIALGLYRYASSDTRALPVFATAGSQFWVANVYEIGGVTGTFATDHASTKTAYVAATSSAVTTTSDTTTNTNQLAITSFGNFASNVVLAAPTGADLMQSYADNSEWGAWACSEVYETSSGVTVQTTWTPTAASPKVCGWIQDIWGAIPAVVYTLTAAEGTITLTGKAALLPVARKVTAVQGSYALTGKAAGLSAGRRVTAAQGSYTLTGEAAGGIKHLSVLAVRGTYTLTGEDISHISARSVVATTGFYHLLGEAVLGGRAVILKAHRGRYRVHKQKTVLRSPTSTRTIWPVDAGDYILDGQDVVFGQERFRLTFSGFINPDYLDWPVEGGADYESYLHTNFVTPSDAMAWAQVPYLYVFVAETDTATDKGLLLNVVRNWSQSGNTSQIGDPIQVYRHRDGYLMSVTKNRINGRGRAMQLQYKSETGKAFNIRGWAMWLEKNSKV